MSDPFVDGMTELLRSIGVAQNEIDAAATQGPDTLVVLYADHAFIQGHERLTRSEVAERADIDLEEAMAFWRALGFAHVPPDERAFTEVDVDVLRRVGAIIGSGLVDRDLALQTTRVMGLAVSQIAAALVDTTRRGFVDGLGPQTPQLLSGLPMLLSDLERWLTYVLRRHLAAEAKRAAVQATSEDAGIAVVGFADLVGFAGISQSLDEDELAVAVGRFEAMAMDLVSEHGGRAVKMIGDEVMFEAPDAAAGAAIALDLVRGFADDDTLPDVRVGLAADHATRHQGDIFGNAPNLASRLVEEAYPATVLVSASIRESLRDEPGYTFKAVRPHSVKGFGRIRFYVLRRTSDEPHRPAWRLPLP